MRKVSYLSYTMTTADANNPDGIVPVGRQFDFIGDVETEEMILVDGDESLCLGYTGVEVYKDVYVGDGVQSYSDSYRKHIQRLPYRSIQTGYSCLQRRKS